MTNLYQFVTKAYSTLKWRHVFLHSSERFIYGKSIATLMRSYELLNFLCRNFFFHIL